MSDHKCDDCGRPAVLFIRKKYPAKEPVRKYVCGYHKRPYMTSEFARVELLPPPKQSMGYAPV